MKLKRPGTAVVFTLLTGAFIALLAPRVFKVEQLKSRYDRLQLEVSRLRNENQTLERELRLLRDDPVYLEKVAREKFNKAKEGEIVYKVVRPGEQAGDAR